MTGARYERLTRDRMAARVARDIPEGAYVNLGIGLPTMVGNHLPKDRDVFLHSENGLVGVGPAPAETDIDWDLIDAGKNPITLKVGAARCRPARAATRISSQAAITVAGCRAQKPPRRPSPPRTGAGFAGGAVTVGAVAPYLNA